MRALKAKALVGITVFTTALVGLVPSPALSAETAVKALKVDLDVAGVAKTSRKDVIKRTANNHDDAPFMNGEPEHVRVVFDSDKVADYTDYLQRQLRVYPVAPYAALFQGKEKVAFDEGISQLKKIISSKSDKGVKQIFILPAAEAAEEFRNHLNYLTFKQGAGVAFVTCYTQDEAPVKNGDFFYTFQGLTTDGKYYVSFFCPVTAKNPPSQAKPKATGQFLSKLTSAQFTPKLDDLHHLIQSISVQ
jgi:hypothetical protein